ncbi:MAG: HAMP domain-containing protein [Fibrobacterota bacterium]
MLGFNFDRKSISYKTALTYLILTILNVSLFTFMVFENQLDLISENTLLTSESKSTNIRIKMDGLLDKQQEITPDIIAAMQKELRSGGIKDFTLFQEDCKIIVESLDGKVLTRQRKPFPAEIAGVIKSIQKNSFENRIFYHVIDRKHKVINLYVPISYGLDKTVVVKAMISMKDVNDKMKNLVIQCVIIGVLVVFIHIISALFLSKTIIAPILEIYEATKQVAQGDVKARVNILRDDEIGRLAIAFNEMSVALQHMREMDRGANPLTGLPGNITIAQEIDRRLNANEKLAVIYADLDNFKAYNDKYGFTRGDDVILYTRDCFNEATKALADKRIFNGHEGGDDFVTVVPFELWEPCCKQIIGYFDHDITQFYNETDARNGYIDSVSRQGERMRFPLMTISLAVVCNMLRPFSSHVELVSVAAEMKKVVKKMEGSSYAIDRRKV